MYLVASEQAPTVPRRGQRRSWASPCLGALPPGLWKHTHDPALTLGGFLPLVQSLFPLQSPLPATPPPRRPPRAEDPPSAAASLCEAQPLTHGVCWEPRLCRWLCAHEGQRHEAWRSKILGGPTRSVFWDNPESAVRRCKENGWCWFCPLRLPGCLLYQTATAS